MLRGLGSNQWPLGYEPNELPTAPPHDLVPQRTNQSSIYDCSYVLQCLGLITAGLIQQRVLLKTCHLDDWGKKLKVRYVFTTTESWITFTTPSSYRKHDLNVYPPRERCVLMINHHPFKGFQLDDFGNDTSLLGIVERVWVNYWKIRENFLIPKEVSLLTQVFSKNLCSIQHYKDNELFCSCQEQSLC